MNFKNELICYWKQHKKWRLCIKEHVRISAHKFNMSVSLINQQYSSRYYFARECKYDHIHVITKTSVNIHSHTQKQGLFKCRKQKNQSQRHKRKNESILSSKSVVNTCYQHHKNVLTFQTFPSLFILTMTLWLFFLRCR